MPLPFRLTSSELNITLMSGGAYVAEIRPHHFRQVHRRRPEGSPHEPKELAQRILREEDQQPISPQYLNDIERDRRSPSSDHLIHQFAHVLKIDPDYLHYLAGKLPEEIRQKNLSEEAVKNAFMAFRKSHKKS